MFPLRVLLLALAAAAPAWAQSPFRPQVIDAHIRIGYGLAVADVDGDGRDDILLADAHQIVWYRNPSWEKFVIAEQLTPRDHVCIAARDIDGDGKAEIAVGAQWNPSDTVESGAVFYLVPPADRTQPWRPVKLPHEPTTHRMHWVRDADGGFFLAVLPLHGRGNRQGEGAGIRFLGYRRPADVDTLWSTLSLNEEFHLAHNFDRLVPTEAGRGEELIVAAKEGVHHLRPASGRWQATRVTPHPAGEVRVGRRADGSRFVAAVEPMHGNTLAVYSLPQVAASGDAEATRLVLDEGLVQGHALAVGDFLGAGHDQIVVGWRGGIPGAGGRVGLKLYAPTRQGTWELHTTFEDGEMACEDLQLADLNGDGRLDLIAAGRATKNVVIYWNEAP